MGIDVNKVAADLGRILAACDVLGLQEWGGNDRERLLEQSTRYDYVKPGARTGSVVWDAGRFRLVRARAVVAAEARYVGRIPGLKSRLPEYQVGVVTLRDYTTGDAHRAQDRVTIINCHAPVWRPGARARMHADYLRTVARLHAEYAAAGHQVFTLGDWNRTPRFIRDRFASTANALSVWSGRKSQPTHHRRSIDDIYHRCRARTVATVATCSDHRAVLASY